MSKQLTSVHQSYKDENKEIREYAMTLLVAGERPEHVISKMQEMYPEIKPGRLRKNYGNAVEAFAKENEKLSTHRASNTGMAVSRQLALFQASWEEYLMHKKAERWKDASDAFKRAQVAAKDLHTLQGVLTADGEKPPFIFVAQGQVDRISGRNQDVFEVVPEQLSVEQVNRVLTNG